MFSVHPPATAVNAAYHSITYRIHVRFMHTPAVQETLSGFVEEICGRKVSTSRDGELLVIVRDVETGVELHITMRCRGILAV